MNPNSRNAVSNETGDQIRSPVPPFGPEFLIIYHDLLGAPAKDLATWKNARGLDAKAIAISEILKELIELDGKTVRCAEKNVLAIKRYLRRRMASAPGLQYVLLFGDSNLIETETLYGDPNEANSGYASDYYFSTAADHDTATANTILYPEFAIGRLPLSSVEEALEVVDRIINYEKEAHPEPLHHKRITLAIEPPIDGTDREGHRRTRAAGAICDCLHPAYNIELIDYRSAAATDEIARAAEEGRLLIAHRGHGCEGGWLIPEFRIANLKRSKFPSVFYCVDCLSGMFNRPSGRDSYAEASLKNGAAVSMIAATGITNEVLNNYFIQALFDGTFGGILPAWSGVPGAHHKKTRLGDVLVYAKAYLPFVLGTTAPGPGRLTDEATLNDPAVRNQLVLGEIRKMFEMYHVLGDPTLVLRT